MECDHIWEIVKTEELSYHGKWPCNIVHSFCKRCQRSKTEHIMDPYGLNKPHTLTKEEIVNAINGMN